MAYAHWGRRFWPLLRIRRCPLFGGYKSTVSMGVTIRSTGFGRCRESGRSSGARCSEVSLYMYVA